MMRSGSSTATRRALGVALLLVVALATMLVTVSGAYAAIGAYKGKWGTIGSGDGQFNNPTGIAVAPNGDIYVSDMLNHRIQYFSAVGGFKGKWGSSGAAQGQFSHPWDVAVARNGDVYVVDRLNNRIQYFTSTGTYKGQWGSAGTANGQFDDPISLAIAPNGDVYVADWDNKRVQYFSPTGTFEGKWGSGGAGDSQFDGPISIAVAPNGDVYVADTANHRIQYFTGQIAIQDDEGGVTFQRWVPGKGAAYSGGGYTYSPWAGSVFEARFTGSRIAWYGPKQPSYGKAEVFIDGAYKATVDCYAPSGTKTIESLIWQSAALSDGAHTLQIAPTDTKNALSTGTVVVVDRFELDGAAPKGYAMRADDEAGTYTGAWVKGTSTTYIGNAYRYSRYPTASFEIAFKGKKVAWIGPKTGAYGRAKVYIDGVLQGTVSQRGTMGWRERVWESKALSSGIHTLKIVPTGTKDAASTAANIVIDAIDVVP